ncbi:5-formyltetrahydrofolate cyclo-ligase [Luteipulveratus halotolerans]|uniref:5-formyltetrahydrofolate cyclo-ligase n=1 Tax=Luteipulveratus halotolerans TaxID=1631356 RepID=A0A0L6CJT4_9MICO|nr:5-formyltetrahydrofolate cyclo-ligase [Luteipulveratus halotolerans]KNX38047.1 hypothetical protein VV01_14285 [Luteipulveratus halotolerans]
MWRTLPDTKAQARRVVRAERRHRRDTPSYADRAADAAALTDAVLATLGEATTVAAYESLPTEPPTETLIARLTAAGHRVLLPVLLPDNDLDWRAAGSDSTPLGRAAIGEAGLVVVPALAIGRDGMRLGQGGGSYDRALARRTPGTRLIALVYDDELAAGVPTDPHDQAVDAVVTPGHGLVDLPSGGTLRLRD